MDAGVCGGDTVDSDDHDTPDACGDCADEPARAEPATCDSGVLGTAVHGEFDLHARSDLNDARGCWGLRFTP